MSVKLKLTIMKKVNWFVVCGLILLGACFAACSDDDNGGGWDGESAVVDAHDYDIWTYFNFKTGETKTLNVKSQEGGITGIYTGDLGISVMGSSYGGQEDVKLIISTVTADTVLLSLDSLGFSMSGEVDPYSLSAKATIKQNGDKWVLTGVPTDVDVVNGGEITVYHEVTFSGEIGAAAGSAASIKVTFKPGGMPMAITGTYTVKDRDNKVYMLEGDETSFAWDIAFHKYDVKTNGGAAVKLNTTDLALVTASSISGESFAMDTDGHQVMVDMSKMMEGFVGYQTTKLNEVLCGWVTATPTGSMPPYTYELNSNVFVVRTADGQYAKVKFTDYSNDKNVKVYAAFDYEFPLK